jgi:hypothetical protein
MRSFKRDEEGQALVELALVMPFLLLLIMAILQFGEMYNVYNNLTDAARIGARQLSIEAGESDPCTPAIQAAMTSTAGDVNVNLLPSYVVPSFSSTSDTCGSGGTGGSLTSGDTATITITYPYTLSVFGMGILHLNLHPQASDAVE